MTSTIILKTDSNLKQKAQETAEELGLTLTSVINSYLSDFVETKKVTFQTKNVKEKFVDPYGIFANANISEKDIKDVTNSWDNILNEFK